ncbi:MAG: RDD family protein [Nitriliruptoraceae bacterium]|nr:RDD family protein [Nitriliruptoraceae bacterium]
MSDQNPPPNQQPGQQPPPPAQQQPPPPAQQQPPMAPQAPQPAGGGQYGDLANRFFAKLIDWILLGIVYAVVVIPLTIALAFGSAAGASPFGGFSIGSLLISVIYYAVVVGYFALLESNRGQTLGKMLLKLKVVGPDGNNPTMEQALKRNAYILIAIVPILGGLAYLAAVIYIAVTINNNAQRNGFHDDFAGGTRVIKVG